MSKQKHQTVLIIGAGPRIIGQSAECDEGALEAARTLTDHHCRIITVNSNPDAIITAPPWAYRSYLEPLTTFSLNQIIAAEKPDAVLPTFGGRQALHLAADLAHSGVLGNDKTALWGSSADSVEQVLNRDTLNSALSQIGLATPSIFRLSSMETAIEKAQELGFPVVLRRADTDLMPDGALIYNQDELRHHALPEVIASNLCAQRGLVCQTDEDALVPTCPIKTVNQPPRMPAGVPSLGEHNAILPPENKTGN